MLSFPDSLLSPLSLSLSLFLSFSLSLSLSLSLSRGDSSVYRLIDCRLYVSLPSFLFYSLFLLSLILFTDTAALCTDGCDGCGVVAGGGLPLDACHATLPKPRLSCHLHETAVCIRGWLFSMLPKPRLSCHFHETAVCIRGWLFSILPSFPSGLFFATM